GAAATAVLRPGGGRDEKGHVWTEAASSWRTLDVGDDLPVVAVVHEDARAYAKWAGLRLPDGLEWDRAALWDPQAGRPRKHPWGDEMFAERVANVCDLDFKRFYPEWPRRFFELY